MPRSRVLSFMSQWGSGIRPPFASNESNHGPPSPKRQQQGTLNNVTPNSSSHNVTKLSNAESPTPMRTNSGETRTLSRPSSMLQTYQPMTVDTASDTIPELLPIFTYLNSHSNKLYQEGYFLKLNDLDARGRPCPDRNWTECFAQLVGTVLALWDAAQLDAAGPDGEVVPTFINLADASIKMIESLPMSSDNAQALQNVLSISTAASNRYLLHFNSLNSLTQWTASIRLTMFEYTSLQEAYTGGLVAGKGKTLNSIRQILDRTQFNHEDWVRVRFGAGTPWRRYWCVISPPDQKEIQKLQKSMKRQTIYNRVPPVAKGNIKFYESSKVTKKSVPIATISDAYSAYALYPQSKSLIDQSTLIKLEGDVTVHAPKDSTVEGLVFIMPESHPAVPGFEILLRTIFPIYDTFALYGRPTRLAADPIDTRSLMFAMPKDQRYGYLDVLDVATLLHTEGSYTWSERQWRKQLKDLTAKRMSAMPTADSTQSGRVQSRRNTTSRVSLPRMRSGGITFEDEGPTVVVQPSTQPSSRRNSMNPEPRLPSTDSDPAHLSASRRHQRSVSEAHGYAQYQNTVPSRLSHELVRDDSYQTAPLPPEHKHNYENRNSVSSEEFYSGPEDYTPDASGNRQQQGNMPDVHAIGAAAPPPGPVSPPPVFAHGPGQKPPTQPYQATDLRRASSQVDNATLSEIRDASSQPIPADASATAEQGYMADGPPLHVRQPNGSLQRRRLSTIPASPYVDSSNFSPVNYNSSNGNSQDPNVPAVPSHANMPQTHYFEQHQQQQYTITENATTLSDTEPRYSETQTPDVKLKSQHSISRKPVGASSKGGVPTSPVSMDSGRQASPTATPPRSMR